MQRLFQSFERSSVRHLLISGQAAVLYGAASFSEDVDVWIDPAPRNISRFLASLAAIDATVYELTPAMSPRNVSARHAFHFLVPDGSGSIFLDVMPRPPRVPSFAVAYRRRRRMVSSDGELDVVSIEDLVELKKAGRLADYDVITNLVAIQLRGEAEPDRRLLRWAAKNCFRAVERVVWLRLLGENRSLANCERAVMRELARLQAKDRRHWSRIIDDLRRLRSRDALIAEGTPVRELLRG